MKFHQLFAKMPCLFHFILTFSTVVCKILLQSHLIGVFGDLKLMFHVNASMFFKKRIKIFLIWVSLMEYISSISDFLASYGIRPMIRKMDCLLIATMLAIEYDVLVGVHGIEGTRDLYLGMGWRKDYSQWIALNKGVCSLVCWEIGRACFCFRVWWVAGIYFFLPSLHLSIFV